MKKTAALFIMLYVFLSILCSCEPIRKPLDSRTGFSKCLKETENYIRNEDWQNAMDSLENANKAWKRLKPIIQVDVDHDYINVIETNFTLLKAYIETREKSDSLGLILIIQQDWKNIGSM